MKKITFFIICLIIASSAFSQLTTRENDETNVKLGARPKKGDMALVFGYNLPTGSSDTAKLFNYNQLRAGDLLTFKYYRKDNLAYRAAIRLMKFSNAFKGTTADSSALNPMPSNIKEEKYKNVRTDFEIVPGIETHFLKSNFFDVYMGADVLLGFGTHKVRDDVTYRGGAGESNYTCRTPFKVFGFGGLVGVNAFIAQLPIAIGIEYGLSAKWTFGGVSKIKVDETIGSDTKSAEYKIKAEDGSLVNPTQYSKLSRHTFGMDTNQDVRIVLNIYFAK
jgi:hypothetical protein